MKTALITSITGQDDAYLAELLLAKGYLAHRYVEGTWPMLQQETPGDYVLTTGETHPVRDFVDLSFAEVGIPIRWEREGVNEIGLHAQSGEVVVEVDPHYFRPTEVELLIGDPSKAKRILGWQATTPFLQLARDMVQSDLSLVQREADYRRVDVERGKP